MPNSMNRPQDSIFVMTYIYYIYRRYLSKLEFLKNNPYRVGFPKFSALIKRYHEKIVDKMIYEQYQYSMPYRLGELFIAKLKPRIVLNEDGTINYDKTKIQVNRKKTKQYNKTHLFYNNHTKGYYMKFHWRKWGGQARVQNIGIYHFYPQHPNRQKLSHAINELYTKGKIDFYEIKPKYYDIPRKSEDG